MNAAGSDEIVSVRNGTSTCVRLSEREFRGMRRWRMKSDPVDHVGSLTTYLIRPRLGTARTRLEQTAILGSPQNLIVSGSEWDPTRSTFFRHVVPTKLACAEQV